MAALAEPNHSSPLAKIRTNATITHVRKVEGLASFRQRDPRIAQAGIVFAPFGIVCFHLLPEPELCIGRPFPMRFGSSFAFGPSPFHYVTPRKIYIAITAHPARLVPLTFLC